MINRITNYLLRIYYSKLGLYNSINLEKFLNFDNLINSIDLNRIKSLKKYEESSINFLGKNIKFSDNEAFIGMVNEIFIKKNYMFISQTNSPLILDCGANIGLSTIFFKQIYPNSKIICFEPDPKIYDLLKYNLNQFNYDDIQIFNSAVWVRDEKLIFESDKSWGGKIVSENNNKTITIDAINLNKYLAYEVDFLKIDIEGAEYEVIKNSSELILKNVKNIFFEWHSLSDKKQKLGELLHLFESNNFRYHLKEASPKGAPFIEKRQDQLMDTQIDCFIYKE
jgi:FkbM family methyltransferase